MIETLTSSAGRQDVAWPRAGRPVVSGQIPPLAASYSPRQETGVDPASLPPGRTTVLLPPDDGAARSLRGLGGTGKTHLAATVARGYLNQGAAGLVLWITATLIQATREDLDIVASHARAKLGIDLRKPAR